MGREEGGEGERGALKVIHLRKAMLFDCAVPFFRVLQQRTGLLHSGDLSQFAQREATKKQSAHWLSDCMHSSPGSLCNPMASKGMEGRSAHFAIGRGDLFLHARSFGNPGNGVASVVSGDVEVLHIVDSHFVHAHLHEEVLTERLVIHFWIGLALIKTTQESRKGCFGDDLETAEEAKCDMLAIRKVDAILGDLLAGQLELQPVWQEHGIRIDLDRPIIICPATILGNCLPRVCIERRIDPCTCGLTLCNMRGVNLYCRNPREACEFDIAEEHLAVTSKHS